MTSRIYFILILFAVTFIFYANTLSNGFVHDDIWQVEQNQTIKNFNNLTQVFSGCIAEQLLGGCKNIGFYYRPTQSFLYLLVSQISHQPWIFHLTNLLLGFASAVLLFIFLELILKNRFFAFIAALLFLTHPANSEVINWISATPEMLLAIFIFSTLIFLQVYLQKKKNWFLFASVTTFFLALLTKETAFFYLAVLPVLVLLNHKSKLKPKNFYFLGYYLIPGIIYLLIRLSVLGRVVYKYEGYYSLDSIQQLFTAFTLFPKYLLKLIYPFPLSFQPQIPPVLEYENTVMLSFILVFAVLGLLYYLYQTKQKNLLLGLSMIIIGITPALIFVNKLGENLFSERYLFIPVAGFSLIVIDSLKRGIGKYQLLKKNYLIALLIIFLSLSFITVFQRNRDWKDNLTTYQAMVRVDPTHKKAHLMMGNIYLEEGSADKAISEYQTALKIDPGYREAKNALDLLTKRYKSELGLTFYYPEGWNLDEQKDKIIISDPKKEINIQLSLKNLEKSQLEDFANAKKLNDELFKNQGPAKIPNFERAYVNIYEVNLKPKLHFFLQENQKVVEVLVHPADSTLMPEFDKILGSLRFENNEK